METFKVKLKGHSNFILELIKEPNGYFVKKSDGERLHKQCEKQDLFRKYIINSNQALSCSFDVPKIVERVWQPKRLGNKFSFTMPFYNGKSILDVLEKGDITLLDDMIDKLFIFLKWEFDNSKIQEIDCSKVRTKLMNIHQKVANIELKNFIQALDYRFYNNFKTTKIPIGFCHGDFTFSNMIFSNKIILIDFLDSFVETPLQDVAKLLQSLNLQWELLMDDSKRDITKIKIGYEYLRLEISSRILTTYPEYLKMIDVFYMITLLRILPYVKEKKIYNVVTKEIERIKL